MAPRRSRAYRADPTVTAGKKPASRSRDPSVHAARDRVLRDTRQQPRVRFEHTDPALQVHPHQPSARVPQQQSPQPIQLPQAAQHPPLDLSLQQVNLVHNQWVQALGVRYPASHPEYPTQPTTAMVPPASAPAPTPLPLPTDISKSWAYFRVKQHRLAQGRPLLPPPRRDVSSVAPLPPTSVDILDHVADRTMGLLLANLAAAVQSHHTSVILECVGIKQRLYDRLQRLVEEWYKAAMKEYRACPERQQFIPPPLHVFPCPEPHCDEMFHSRATRAGHLRQRHYSFVRNTAMALAEGTLATALQEAAALEQQFIAACLRIEEAFQPAYERFLKDVANTALCPGASAQSLPEDEEAHTTSRLASPSPPLASVPTVLQMGPEDSLPPGQPAVS